MSGDSQKCLPPLPPLPLFGCFGIVLVLLCPAPEEDEVELIQIKINGVNYAVEEENQIDGPIYSLGFDGDVDEEVGKYVKGKPTFYKK